MMPTDSANIKSQLLEKISSIEDSETLNLVVTAVNNIIANNESKTEDQTYNVDFPQTSAGESFIYGETHLKEGISEQEYRFAMATIEESRQQINRGEGVPHDKVSAMVRELFLKP